MAGSFMPAPYVSIGAPKAPVVPVNRVRPDQPKPALELPPFPLQPRGAKLTPREMAARQPHQRARSILADCARDFGLRPEDILGPRRSVALVAARKALLAGIATECPSWSLPRIGRFVNRDHTTCLYHLRAMGLR